MLPNPLRPVLFLLVSGFPCFAVAEEATFSAEQLEFFEKKIRPVLVRECYECHSAEAKILRGGLLVDSRSGLMTGGDSGPSVVAGESESSLLLEALRYESYEMPPQGKLSEEIIKDFESWIAMGAPDPRLEPTKIEQRRGMSIEEGRQFWAFRPLKTPSPPTVTNTRWPRSTIDLFILAKIEENGLTPVGDADKLTLLRRLSFDLTGLPPTPREMDAFLQDSSPDAVETVVDLMLESPQFGERWGRHWLDVARYADSTGGGRSMLYGESWKYRDYVIDSFNKDKPFDRFVVEQIAGDLMPHENSRQGAEQLTATAFLALGPHNYENQDKEQLRMDVIDEQIDTIGKVFLGMTIGCARCHDHKFDPIPQADYYALAGIFRSTNSLVDGNVSKWVTAPIPRSPEHQRHLEEFEAEQKRLNAEIENVSKQLKRLEAKLPKTVIDDSEATFVGEWTPSTSIKGFVGQGYQHSNNPDHVATFTTKLDRGNYKVQVAYTAASNRATKANVTLKSGENEAQRSIDQRKTPPIDGSYLDLGTFSLDGETTVSIRPTEQLATIVDAVRFVRLPDDMQKGDEIAEKLSATTQHLLELRRQLDELEKRKPAAPETVIAVAEQPDPGDTHLCIRGDHKHLGEIVPRGFLSVVETEPVAIPSDQSGRLELAQWIASPDNPLTARVLVNRVWSHLFGEGLVRTVDNFGVPGEAPSHPRLLDHLATEFINDEWSIKRLIRRIVLSRTYQLESAPRSAAPEDPENRLLTHQRRRRLDAECLHDAMLRVSGELLGDGRGNTVRSGTNSEYGYEFEYGRRAVYHPIFRNRIPEILTAFDFADPNMPIGKRTPTTLSTQALLMMNSPFVEDRVTAATDQILRERDSDQDRLEWLSASCFGRPLTSDERQLIERFLDSTSAEDPTQAWEMVVRAMFGSVAFRYLD